MNRRRDWVMAFAAALLLHGGLVLGIGLVLSIDGRSLAPGSAPAEISLDVRAMREEGEPAVTVAPLPVLPEERAIPVSRSLPGVDRITPPDSVAAPAPSAPAAASDVRVDPLSLVSPAPVPVLSGVPTMGVPTSIAGSVIPSDFPVEQADGQGARNRPTALSRIKPHYPLRARTEGHEGLVTIRVRVGAEGQIEAAEVVRSSGFTALDEAAIGAVNKARFAPAERDGRRVSGEINLTFEFRLKE